MQIKSIVNRDKVYLWNLFTKVYKLFLEDCKLTLKQAKLAWMLT